jgi:hypothetical protein
MGGFQRGARPTSYGDRSFVRSGSASLRVDRVVQYDASAVQCDMSTGTVIEARMLRVTPPSANSRRRECP